MGGSTDINYPQQPSYSESLKDSLTAQIDLAKPLFESEASKEYGRPAYAQLETDILRDTLLGKERWQEQEGGEVATPQRPEGVFDVTNENEQWEAYVNLHPDLIAAFPDQAQGRSKAEFGKEHYNVFGQTEQRMVPEIGKTYDPTTSMEYAPQMGEMVRGGGLMDLLGGRGQQQYGTGGVGQEFVTRKATESDVSAGTAKYVGQEISEGRIRDGQMIGDTRDVLISEQRRPGFDPSGENFMGLAQYGSDIAEQSARRQRTADIADVQRLGGIASQAIREADPLSAGLLGTMGEQATEGLAAGQDLTQRERERATQDARSAWGARGRIRDPGAVVSELENLESARRAREAQRRAFATQTMQASRAMTADPFMAILGRPSGASQQIATQGLGGAQYGLGSGPQLYNPEAGLSYQLGQSQNMANVMGAEAAANATRQAGLMGMVGKIGGAGLGGLLG